MSESVTLSDLLGLPTSPAPRLTDRLLSETSRFLEEEAMGVRDPAPKSKPDRLGVKEARRIVLQFFPPIKDPSDESKVTAIAEHLVDKSLVKDEAAADVILRHLVREGRIEAMKSRQKIPVLDRVFARVRVGGLVQ